MIKDIRKSHHAQVERLTVINNGGENMFTRLGAPEILVILAVGLLIFGPNKLPELGKSLGDTIKQFKSAAADITTEKEKTDKEVVTDEA